MTRRIGLFVSICIAVVATAAIAYYAYEQRTPRFDTQGLTEYYSRLTIREAEPVDPEAVREGIVAAVGYLKRYTLPSGQFVYLVNTNPQVEVKPSYNMLRHGGAIYALGLANEIIPDADAVSIMERSTKFMRQCCLQEIDGKQMVGMWEPGSLTHASEPPTFKLGGAGVALLALSAAEKVNPSSISVPEMQGLARLGGYLMKWNGAFYPRYIPSQGGRSTSGAVLYYPGEMILGWMAMYDQHPSPELMEWSVKAMMHLARQRAAERTAPPDHWALISTAEMFRLADRDHVEIPREALLNHAMQICHEMLETAYVPPVLLPMEGSLVPLGKVVSTSSRLEGLLAALSFLPPEHPMTAHVESAVHRGVAFLLRAQVKDGPYAGGFPMAIMLLPTEMGPDVGKFNREATEIRVDHLGHAIGALAHYAEWRRVTGAEASSQARRKN